MRVAEEDLRPHAGRYRLGSDLYVVAVEGGRLWVTGPGGRRMEGIPQGGDRFYLRPSNAVLRFTPGPGGRPGPMLLQQSETLRTCLRLDPEVHAPGE